MNSDIASPDAQFETAYSLQREGRFTEALEIYQQLRKSHPTSAVLTNMGAVLLNLGRPHEAIAVLLRVVAARPELAGARYNLANGLDKLRLWPEAEAAFREALRLDPNLKEAQLNLARLLLGLGRYKEGWPLLEIRADIAGSGAVRPATSAPEWKGEPLEGKSIFICREQGYGDQIQFARFAPALKAMGAEVSLACLPELAPLLAPLADSIVAIGVESAVSIPRPDFWTFPQSIPARLGTTLETLPPAPYLEAPAAYRRKWDGFVPPGLNAGLVWKGNPRNSIDARRSLPSRAHLAPLEGLGVNLIDLQEPLGDFADLAAVIEQLDVLITVDTAPAHLAGALGKPCWILYPYEGTDWRWLWDRADSPWYGSVRIYRQPAPGDWGSILADVARDLRALALSAGL